MGIEKVNVQITADEREAIASVKRVEREVNHLEAEAKQAQRAVDGARHDKTGLRARFGTLLGKAGFRTTEGGIEASAFRFGAAGFGLRDSFKKGSAGQLLVGYALVQGGMNVLEDVAEFRDEFKDVNLRSYLRNRTPAALAGLGNLTQSLVHVMSRYTHGFTREQSDLASAEVAELIRWWWESRFSDSAQYDSPIDAVIREQAATFRANREMIEHVNAKRREAAEAAMRKIDESVEAQLGALKTDIFRPKDIRLHREQNRRAQRLFRDAKERDIRTNAAAAKEPHQQVLDGEGR